MPLSRRTLLAGALSAAGLAGCARADSDPLAGKDPAPPRGPVTIQWAAAPIDGRDGSDLRPALVEAFQTAHPDITVRVTKTPPTSDTQRSTFATQIAAGSELPDVYLGDCAWPAQFGENALATPLDELVPAGFWEDFAEPVVTSLTYDGRRWAFPFYLAESFLYYRSDLLAKHDLAVPGTWEELARTARKLVDAGDVRYGFLWQGAPSETITANISEFLSDADGSFVTADYGAAAIDGPAGRRTAEFIDEMMRTGVSPRAVGTYSEQESVTAYSSGQAAFLRNWDSLWTTIASPEESAVAGRTGVAPRPTFAGTRTAKVSTVGGWHNYINPHTRNLGAALQFARWLSEVPAQLLLCTRSAHVPASETALEHPRLQRDDLPTFRVAPELELHPRPTRTPYYPQISDAVRTAFNALVIGSRGPGGLTRDVAAGINSALAGVAL
ncbi:ABC transporter substrate-binding protein [Salinifilum aidingensis]